MTVFFDTNVLLDILDDTREHHEVALTLLQAAEKGVFRAYVTTQSFLDAAYIQTQQRKLSIETFRASVSLLSGILSVESILASDLAKANCNKQIYLRHFFAKLFRHFSRCFGDSSVLVYT